METNIFYDAPRTISIGDIFYVIDTRERNDFSSPCRVCNDEKKLTINGITFDCPVCGGYRSRETVVSVQHFTVATVKVYVIKQEVSTDYWAIQYYRDLHFRVFRKRGHGYNGDGKRIVHIVNEKGKTATLTQNNVCDAYEVAMGRKIRTAQGLADIKQLKNILHVIYFETCGIDEEGAMPIAKTMLYGVTSTRPAESFDQNTDDINESSFDTALEISGTPLLAANGANYKDDKGNEVVVWQMTVTPDDEGYDIFGSEVVLPKMAE